MNNTNTIIAVLIVVLVLGGVLVFARQDENLGLIPPAVTTTEPSPTLPADTTTPTGQPETPTLSQSVLTVHLNPVDYNVYDQSGTATLTESKGKTTVDIEVNALTGLNNQPAHIHTGGCANIGGVMYPLKNVVDGKSITVINTSLKMLKGQLPLAINIHKSASEINTNTSCGDISR